MFISLATDFYGQTSIVVTNNFANCSVTTLFMSPQSVRHKFGRLMSLLLAKFAQETNQD